MSPMRRRMADEKTRKGDEKKRDILVGNERDERMVIKS